jgi:4-amino-4-deoxy-L-arabinose transferase-like glycosyltransferase
LTATSFQADEHAGRAASLAVLFLVALVLLVINLGRAPLFDVDEGAFSEATREMLESGDWLSTTLNGRPRFDKPILIYWLQAASVSVFGLTEFALRLPSVLAAALWCALIGRFAATNSPHGGSGVVATTVAASSLGVFVIGRAATADAVLNFFLAATLFDGWAWYRSRERAPLLRAYLWMGLGLLTKGPIAVIVPAAVSLVFFLSIRRWRDWLQLVTSGRGWLLLLVVALPWYAAAFAIHGRAFFDGFLMRHNVERFTGTLEGHAGSLVYYIVAAPLLLLPWAPALWTVVKNARADIALPWTRLLWVWFVVVIVFFSLSATKLPHYALYGLTPLFLLLAVRRDAVPSPLIAVAAAFWFTALALAPILAEWVVENGWVRNRYYAALFEKATLHAGVSYLAIVLGLGIVAVVLAARRSLSTDIRWTGVAVASNLALALAFAPWLGEVLQGPVKRAGEQARELHEPVSTWNFDAPSFSVYRRAATLSRPPQQGEVALTRIDRLPADVPVEEVLRDRGVLLVRRR